MCSLLKSNFNNNEKNNLFFNPVCFLFTSCNKEAKVEFVPTSPEEALNRISKVSKWKVDKITVNGEVVFLNGKALSSEYESIIEYIEFDVSKNKVYAKYPGEIDLAEFDFVIDEQAALFKIIDPANPDGPELYKIKSGGVYKDRFELEENTIDEVNIYTLIPF